MSDNILKKTLQFLILAILVSFIIPASTIAATFYVDATNGSESNNGLSPSTAWKTIEKVNDSHFNPGDSILFKRSEIWREQLSVPSSGSEENPITFGAYGSGNVPVISGANLLTGWSKVVVETNVWQTTCTKEPNIVIFNRTIGSKESALKNLNAANKWFWSSSVLYVYSTSAPDSAYTEPGIEAGTRDYCIYSNNKDYITYENIDLRYANKNSFLADNDDDHLLFNNISSYAPGQSGFRFNNSDTVGMTDCSSDYAQGVNDNGDGYVFNNPCNNVTLTNCSASYNERRGIQSIAENGYFKVIGGKYHHQLGLDASGQGDGIAINANDNILIENVYIHDNSGDSADGIHISGGCANAVIRYCLFERNYNSGIMLSNPRGGEIYNNLLVDSFRYGIAQEQNTTNTLKIYNNTAYNNWRSLYFYSSSPTASVLVKNNILHGSPVGYAAYLSNGLNDSNITMDYNCLWSDNSDRLVYWANNNYAITEFSKYQTTESQDGNSIISVLLFSDASNSNFTLQSSSPCIDAGVNVGLYRDYNGTPVPQGSGVDIGAFEFKKTEPPKDFQFVAQ